MTIRDRAFESYVTTHLAPRKGEITREVLEGQFRRWNATLRRFLPASRDARLIDLGCGHGGIVLWLQDIGYRNAEGIDLSVEQVALATKLGVGNVHQGDINAFLAARRDTYDVIIARDVFEHFDRESLVSMLQLISSSLREGGVLIFQVPNAESPFGNRIRYGDITHEQAFTASSVSQLVRLTGFGSIEVYSLGPIVYGFPSFLRFLAWKCVEALYRTLIAIEVGRGHRIVSQNLLAIARR